jgi:hypothetical protein
MAKGEDIVKYVTQKVVEYIDTPSEHRKVRRQNRRREPWTVRWFGMIPMSISMMFGGRRKKTPSARDDRRR